MARQQTWARNISKKPKKASAPRSSGARSVVGDAPLEALKRRAEDLGLIIHARPKAAGKKKSGKR